MDNKGVLKSIQLHDNLYKKWKLINPITEEYNQKLNIILLSMQWYFEWKYKSDKNGVLCSTVSKIYMWYKKTFDALKTTLMNWIKIIHVYSNMFFEGRQVTYPDNL